MGLKEELAYIENVRNTPTFGHFVHPDKIDCNPKYTNLIEKYQIAAKIRQCDYTQHRRHFAKHRPFIDYVEKITCGPHPNVEQCSPKYYADLTHYLHQQSAIQHICEIGVFLGGGSTYLAQIAVERHLTFDLIDLNLKFLGFTYDRILSIVPEAADHIRIFHGDFPTYVAAGHLAEKPLGSVFAQFDASHRFPDVVKDMTCIAKNKSQFHAFAIQDTHLRSDFVEAEVFVDLAVQAVFGSQTDHIEIGAMTGKEPFYFQNNDWALYTRPNAPEGMLLELSRSQPVYFGKSINCAA